MDLNPYGLIANYEYEYGCVRCQAWHGESDGPIYAEHLMWQSKHGLRRRPIGGWLKEGS